MQVSTKTTTTSEQTVVLTFEDIALALVNAALDDGNGFIGATEGQMKFSDGHTMAFVIDTDPDNGAVRVAFPSHRRDKGAIEGRFTVER